MKDGKVVFNIRTMARELMAVAQRIRHGSELTNFYYARSLHSAYEQLYGEVDFAVFWQAFYKVDDFAVFPDSNPIYTIICERSHVDKQIIAEIVEARKQLGKGKPKENTRLPPQTNHKTNAAAPKRPIKKIGDAPQKVSMASYALDSESSEHGKKADPVAAVDAMYDELDSSDSVVKTKSNAARKWRDAKTKDKENKPAGKQTASRTANAFEDIKERIVQAFKCGLVIPINGLSQAMASNGQGFNHKTAPCSITHHRHPTLTRYLACCSEIIEIKKFTLSFIVLKTAEGERVRLKRKHAYLVSRNNADFAYCVEALVVNLFADRTRIPLVDLLSLFKCVYGVGFEEHIATPPAQWLGSVKSPNMRLTDAGGANSVILVPVGCQEYKEWQSKAFLTRMHKIEQSIRGGDQELENLKGLSIPVHLHTLFPAVDSRSQHALAIASANVPKFVLEPLTDIAPTDQLYSPLWRILHHSLNFDDKRTFFT